MEPTMQTPANQTASTPRTTKKRWLSIALIIIAVIAVAVAAFYLLTSNQDNSSNAAGTVTINSSGFTPQTITVKKGEAVTWTNSDKAAHQIKSDSLSELNSGEPVAPGDSFSFVFEKTGNFTYADPTNTGKFNGTVIVE